MKKILSLMSYFFLFFTIFFLMPMTSEAKEVENVAEKVSTREVIGEIPTDVHHCTHENHRGWFPLDNTAINTYYEMPSGNYYLTEDVTIASYLYIRDKLGEDKNVTLCLNGHLLFVTYSIYVHFQERSSTFTLTDCNQETEHQYYINDKVPLPIFDNGIDLWDTNYAKAQEKGVLKGGIVTGAGLNKTNLTFTPSGYSPFNMYSNIGTVTLEAGTFAGNYTTSVGSAINATGTYKDGKFIMNGGALVGNMATADYGAALYSYYSTTSSYPEKNQIIVNDCFIAYNKGTSCGGVLLLNSYFTMNGGTIDYNQGTSATALADNMVFSFAANVYNVSKYDINGGNFGNTAKSFYIHAGATLNVNGGNFETADTLKKTVLNNIPIALDSMVYDRGQNNKYRYKVAPAWAATPILEDWEYGDKPNEVMGIPAPNVGVKYEYKLSSAADSTYKIYNTTNSYPTEVGEYSLRITTTVDGMEAVQYTNFKITKRSLYVDLKAVDRLYDKKNIYVELEGGELSNVLDKDKGAVGIMFKYTDGDKNLGLLEYGYNNVGEHKVLPELMLVGDAARNYEIPDLDLRVNILEHKLTVKEINFTKIPYIGRDIKELTFTAVVVDELGNEIVGAMKFQNDFGIVEAYNTKKFIFTPTAKNYEFTEPLNNNRKGYNYTEQVIEGSFEGKPIYMDFIFDDLGGLVIQYQGVYGQVYNASNIVSIFEEVYEEFKKTYPEYEDYLASLAPTLKTAYSSGYKDLDTFLKTVITGITLVDTTYSYISVNVKFSKVTYHVTFDYHYNNQTYKEEYTYGQRVKRPANPPQQPERVFIGWYIWGDETGEDVTKKRAWDFSVDIVEREMTLHAEYIDNNLKPDPETLRVEQISDYIMANNEVTSKDIRAFITLKGDDGRTKVIVIDFESLVIEYFAADGRIHFDVPRIKVTAVIDGVEATKVVDLDVRQIYVDTSLIKLPPQTYDYDGTAHSYIADFVKPIGVTGYKALYRLDGKEVAESDVYLPGEYVVTIKLVLVSNDYYANNLTTYLTILEPENLVYVAVRWVEEEFVYDGKHQQPEYKLYVVDNGTVTGQDVTNDVDCTFVYTKDGKEVLEAIDAGNYTIRLVIKSADYIIADDETDTYKYQIKPAELYEEISWNNKEFAYSGEEQMPTPSFTVVGGIKVFPDYELTLAAGNGIDVGTHIVEVKVVDPNYIYTSTSTEYIYCEYRIIQKNVRIEWKYNANTGFSYNGEIQYPTPRFIVGGNEVVIEGYELQGDTNSIYPGSYKVSVVKDSLEGLLEGYQYIKEEDFVCSYKILAVEVEIDWITNSKGYVYNGQVQHPTPVIYNTLTKEDITKEVSFYYSQQPKNANFYENFGIIITDKNYKVTDPNSLYFPFVIEKLDVKAPNKTEMTYNYSGEEYNVLKDLLGEYNLDYYQIVGDDPNQKNAGTYKLSLMLKNNVNYRWSSSSDIVTITWEIKKAKITPIWNGFKFIYNNREIKPVVESFDGLMPVDVNSVNYETDLLYSGDPANAVGIYLMSVALNEKAEWTKNYVLENPDLNYVVAPNENFIVVKIEWSFTETWYNGEIQVPKMTTYVIDDAGNLVKRDIEEITLTGDIDSKWAGVYTVKATVPEGSRYVLTNQNKTYEIKMTSDGQGNNPDGGTGGLPGDGNNGGNNPGSGSGNNNGTSILKDVPLWQLITGFVSILLIVVFVSKGNDKRHKRNRYKKNITTDNPQATS